MVSKKPQLSEYEMIREKNIAEQKLLFLQHMKSLSSAAVARPPQDKRPRKPSFVEKAHYPDATPLKIFIRTHSIPA